MTPIECGGWLLCAFLLGMLATWWWDRRFDADDPEPDHDDVITGRLVVPYMASGDGPHLITATELAAVHVLLAQQVCAVANQMHAEAMQAVIAQVARDEASQWPAELGGAA